MKNNMEIPINFGNSHHSLHGSYRICTPFNKDSHLQGWNEFIPERSWGTTILAKSKALEVHRNDNDHTNLPGKGPRKTPLKRYTTTWKMNGRNLQLSPGNCLQPSVKHIHLRICGNLRLPPFQCQQCQERTPLSQALLWDFGGESSLDKAWSRNSQGLPVILESLFGLIYTFRGLRSSISTKKLFWKSK